MLPPVFAGVIMCLAGRFLIKIIGCANDYVNAFIGAIFGSIIYIFVIVIIYIRPKELIDLYSKIRKK